MIASVISIDLRRTSKLTHPHDYRLIPQAAGFQVIDQIGPWTINFAAQPSHIVEVIVMRSQPS